MADSGDPWQVIIAPRAMKDLQRVPLATRQRLLDAMEGLAAHPRRGDFRKLQGIEDEWRLRVGEWRVRFTFDEEHREVQIFRVLPRGRAYRD